MNKQRKTTDYSRIKIYCEIAVMKRYVCLALFSGMILNYSCTKKNNEPYTCTYDPCQLKAPELEIKQIETYLSDSSLTAEKHCSGLFYQRINAGTGLTPTGCSAVSVTYKGTLTNGKVFNETTTSSFNLLELIQGWKNGLPLIKKVAKLN